MFTRVSLFVCLILFSSNLLALDTRSIPEPLKAWIPWVLEGEESINCPFDYQDFKQHFCAWPDTLTLDVDKKGARFNQHWTVFEESWIPLPGNEQHWPQGVAVNGKPQPVIAREGKPQLHLEKGKYKIEGRFNWQVMPESLLLPQTVGLVRLVVNNKYIEFPRVEQSGKLWLNEQIATQLGQEEDRLGVEVFRQVIDGMPLQLVTRLELKVVGKAREITLGKVIPEHFIPLSLHGPLPMRLESDGMLKLQVRPGNWTIELVARYPGETTTLSLPQSNLPDAELWAFKAQPSLRLAEIEGVDAVDPRQTRIPGDWQNLPVYRMDKSRSFLINVKRRGDPEPSPNELQLLRTLWLDFDGKGYTFQDKVSGQMHRGWRLNMDTRLPLGRVNINGVDQLITRTGDKADQGVEVRHGRIDLVADGRIEESIRTVPAIGWQENFQQVRTQLNLPPGWRLFSVTGADSTRNATWIEKWTLLDIFLVLIGALAINRLMGMKWAGIALVTFVLTWHESAAPQYIWLAVIAALGLLKVAPPGQLRKVSVLFRYVTLLGLIIIVLPYVVDTVRTAIYPQLERTHTAYSSSVPMLKQQGIAGRAAPEEDVAEMVRSAPAKLARKKESLFSSYSMYTDTFDPKSKVQTGPGLPEWQWSSVPISWSGPVQQNQLLKLVLLPPWLTAFLKIVSVLFVLALSLSLAGVKYQQRRVSVDLVKFAFAGFLVGASFIVIPNDVRADMPSPEMLKELKARLMKAPECLPNCAQIARMKLRIRPDILSMRLEVHANEDVVIPLPGRLDVWVPNRVVMDGKSLPDNRISASGLMASGGKTMPLLRGEQNALWLSIPKGRHQIDLSGAIPPVKMLQLPLALKPHQITTDTKGWKVKGVHLDGNIEQALQIERVETDIKKNKTFAQTILPPFVSAKRILRLGLDWRVDNEVTRISPAGSAIAIEVPLLEGESVISENIHVKDGKAQINFSPQDRVIRWQSILPITDTLSLKAADTTEWMEVWHLDVSPVWHAETEGLPEIHHQSSQGTRFPEWRPWPGETLSVSVTRPTGVEGQTLTIDRSNLDIKPGKRATDVSLSFRLRSSQAAQHIIKLPDDVTLKEVSINGQSQPIRLENNKLQLPISPGEQNIEVRWQDASGIRGLMKTPVVDLGVSSVNASVQMTPPRDRWVLFAGGPRLGPAVLFWGVLIVVILVAVGLGRTTITPLKMHHWILLGVGLTQAQLIAALIVVGWFFAIAYRQKFADKIKNEHFNTVQALLALLTFAAMASIVITLGFGLLGYPDMQITGNGSSSYLLKWFDDRIGTVLPSAWFVSVSMWFYRGLMLVWSLWLAFALLGWLKWAWQSYTTEGLWRKKEVVREAEGPGDVKSDKDKWKK